MPPAEVLTIGHSNHAIERFLELLGQHAVTALADVRSVPYSRRNPAYNREALERALAQSGIVYLFMGAKLGAKSRDPAHYENGRVQYRRLAATALFKAGRGPAASTKLSRSVASISGRPALTRCAGRIFLRPNRRTQSSTDADSN